MTDLTIVPGLGHNVPDWAAEESRRLTREFESLEIDVTNLLAEARTVPPSVDDADTANIYTALIKRFRDLRNRCEAMRESEKAPHLRRSEAVDSFFFRLIERLGRRRERDAAGGMDVLLARLNDYNDCRLAEERRKREEEARKAQAEADRLAREAEEAARKVREAEAAARRARSEATIAMRQAEFDAREAAARRIADEAALAKDKATDAKADASAKPADMVRERHDGAINTMKQYWHVEITDAMALDHAALWAFVKDDAKLDALKLWAKTTQYRRPMQGALIEQRSRTDVR